MNILNILLHASKMTDFFARVESYENWVFVCVVEVIVMFMIASVIVLELLESRFSKKKTNIVIAIYLLIMACVNAIFILVFIGRFEIFCQLTLFTFALLLLSVAIYISKWPISQTIFGTLVGISIIAIIMETSMIVMLFFEDKIMMSTAMLIAFAIQSVFLLWFLQKVFKPHFSYTFRELPKNWGLYSFIPVAQIIIHCLYFLYGIMLGMVIDWRICVIMAMVQTIMIFAYKLIFVNMNKARNEEREKMNLKIYQAQVDMLAGQITASREAENSLKIMRHDLKHYVGTLKAFFDNGEIGKAKEYIGYINKNVEAITREFYCENAIINACVGYYVPRAREAKVDIKYKLEIPNNATSNDIEFSTVVANALENAINACLFIPSEQRKIEFYICTEENKILLEVRNTFDKKVEFDENQVPVSKEGIGVTSILSYAKMNVANLQFSTENDVFIFRLIANR